MLDVETCNGDGQQTYRSEHRETSAHIVGNDKALVAFLVSTGAGSTTLGIRHGHDNLLGELLATLVLALLLQQTEGQGSLGGGSTLRDIDDTEFLSLQVVGQFGQIVLADVVSGKQDGGIALVAHEPLERIAQRLNHGLCSEIASADTGHHHGLAVLAQYLGRSLYLSEEFWRDACRQMEPS